MNNPRKSALSSFNPVHPRPGVAQPQQPVKAVNRRKMTVYVDNEVLDRARGAYMGQLGKADACLSFSSWVEQDIPLCIHRGVLGVCPSRHNQVVRQLKTDAGAENYPKCFAKRTVVRFCWHCEFFRAIVWLWIEKLFVSPTLKEHTQSMFFYG